METMVGMQEQTVWADDEVAVRDVVRRFEREVARVTEVTEDERVVVGLALTH